MIKGADMSRTLTLTFYGLPPVANDRLGWRAKAERIKTYRESARLRAQSWRNEHGGATFARCRVSAQISTQGRPIDPTNRPEYVKPLLDGVVAAGLIADDSETYVEMGTFTHTRGPRGITMVVEEAAV